MSLVEKLQQMKPQRNFLFTAIENLMSAEDIKQFYREYTSWIGENAEEDVVKQNPENVANSNIGYCLGYYDQKTAYRWMKALPSASHPVFGRDIPFCEEHPVQEYALVFKTGSDEAKEAILKRLSEDFLYLPEDRSIDPLVEELKDAFSKAGFKVVEEFFLTLDVVVESDEKFRPEYTTLKILVGDRGNLKLGDNEIYALLCGYVEGVKHSLAKEIGSVPEMFIERIYRDIT